MKAYVIGSLSQADQIEQHAHKLMNEGKYDEVSYVKKQDGKPFEKIVSECFDEIEKADIIYAVAKRFDNDKTNIFGKGVTYELEYAQRLGKRIFYIYDLEFTSYPVNNPAIDTKAKELLDQWKTFVDMSDKSHSKNREE